MELDLLERRIRRLVAKLSKQNVHLEVFDHNDIEYGPTLGRGGEGIVQRCTVSYNGLPVEAAVKTVLNSSDDALNITLDEIELLCLSKDPIITTTQKVYGVAAVPEKVDSSFGHLVIITEAGIKNALQLYQDEGKSIPLYVTCDLWSRLAAAVHCIHSKRIIHQDLKPENILVTAIIRDTDGCIDKIEFKIIDLGMGRRIVTDKITSDDILGTNGYHAPEVLFDDSYDFRADIFMLGLTFCVMLLSPTNLRKNALQTLLKKVHEAKQNKVYGKQLFTSVVEPSLHSGMGANISSSIRNMICTMLERLDRRQLTLLDVVSLCNRECNSLRAAANQPPIHYGYSSCCPQDSGIDSVGDGMASQRTLHKIGMLESRVHRQQTSPIRRRMRRSVVNKKSAPRRRLAVRRISTSTTSSEASLPSTPAKRRLPSNPRKPALYNSGTVANTVIRKRSLRSAARRAAKRLIEKDDSEDENEDDYKPAIKRRGLRSNNG